MRTSKKMLDEKIEKLTHSKVNKFIFIPVTRKIHLVFSMCVDNMTINKHLFMSDKKIQKNNKKELHFLMFIIIIIYKAHAGLLFFIV